MPRVSIIMPVYNGEKYLDEAIESIINQTYQDLEFIIISEFGSNEKTTSILQSSVKKDDRIKIIQNSQKIGISASLNLGIDSAKGEYIVRMDGDDISMPDRLAKQVEYMDQHPEIGLGGLKPTIFGDEDWDWKAESEPDQIKADTLFFIPVLHPTAIFRKALFDKYELRYNPIYFCSEDYDLFTRASRCLPIGNILDPSLFKYRRYNSAATYKNKFEGDRVCKSILNENLNLLGLELTGDDISLLYIHTGLVGLVGDKLKTQLIHLDLLLKKIFQANLHIQTYNSISLWKTLHKRWLHAYDIIRYANYKNEELVEEEIKFLWKNSAFSNQNIFLPFRGDKSVTPRVSVVMSLYNGDNYLYEAIFSILTQTYHDWELLIVMDPSTDNSELIVNEFSKYNARVNLYKNTKRLGLASTLNRGIDLSVGDYVARIDDDDIALPQRLEKQVAFLDSHPDVSLVSSWQHHFGDRDSIHNPPEKHEQIKAALLFRCDVCHTTVMFRKNDFNKYNLRYDPSYLSEDFELWTRAIHQIKFATIQEVLGEYRWNGSNITSKKIQAMDIEARKLVARTLIKYLSIRLSTDDTILLAGWSNPFMDHSRSDLIELRKRHEQLLLKIKKRNSVLKIYDQHALEEEMKKRLEWANGNDNVYLIDEKGNKEKRIMLKVMTKNVKRFLKFFFFPIMKFRQILFGNIFNNLKQQLWDTDGHISDLRQQFWDMDGHTSDLKLQLENIDGHTSDFKLQLENIDGHTSDLKLQLENFDSCIVTSKSEIISLVQNVDLHMGDIRQHLWDMDGHINDLKLQLDNNAKNEIIRTFETNKVRYVPGEKIRVVILFQIASFWPSIDTVYNELIKDERFNVKVVLFDEQIHESDQIKTGRNFLLKNKIDFVDYFNFDFSEFRPHYVMLQSPYDIDHRPPYLYSKRLAQNGYRVIYVTYGIELSDTEYSRLLHFNQDMIFSLYRLYCISEEMKKEYFKYSLRGGEFVRALGHPKFDRLYTKEGLDLDNNIIINANGRKIILWKVHFPIDFLEDGVDKRATPYIEEYLNFAKKLHKFNNYYFIFMAHPKFLQEAEDKNQGVIASSLFEEIKNHGNAVIYNNDDYRSALLAADAMIIDRSSILIEAGAIGVPILYMHNADYDEPMVNAVKELIDSYYQGTVCGDIEDFLIMFEEGKDPNKEKRIKAFKKCVPFFDGESGHRIKEDILLSLLNEDKYDTIR